MGCGKPRQVHSVVRTWINDKQNDGVIRRTNNQAPTLGPTHEHKHVCTIFKGVCIRNEAYSYTCRRYAKKPTIGDKIKLLGFQKVGPKNRQPKVTWL